MKKTFGQLLITWFEQNKRDLPWRHTKEPYYIWLSEVILQQTQVKQGLAYYQKFIEHYPTVFDLASACQQDILRDWQDLGYYSRARNLHQSAQIVASQYKGILPNTYKELLKLKGIGEYTAAAIASFCFNEKVAVLDGNVFRVLSRIFGIKIPINTGRGKKIFQKKADDMLFKEQPSIYNQAIMEFGARQCTPKKPNCKTCIFKKTCYAYSHSQQQFLPYKNKPKSKRVRYFYYFIFMHKNKILVQLRQEQDIWKGLNEFYRIESQEAKDIPSLIRQFIDLEKEVIHIYPSQTHLLSHQRLNLVFIEIRVEESIFLTLAKTYNLQIYTYKQLDKLPFPAPLVKYMKKFMHQHRYVKLRQT